MSSDDFVGLWRVVRGLQSVNRGKEPRPELGRDAQRFLHLARRYWRELPEDVKADIRQVFDVDERLSFVRLTRKG